MKRIQKIGIYAVCFCLCVACSADSPFDDWGENGMDGGMTPGGSSGSSDASGTLLDMLIHLLNYFAPQKIFCAQLICP